MPTTTLKDGLCISILYVQVFKREHILYTTLFIFDSDNGVRNIIFLGAPHWIDLFYVLVKFTSKDYL